MPRQVERSSRTTSLKAVVNTRTRRTKNNPLHTLSHTLMYMHSISSARLLRYSHLPYVEQPLYLALSRHSSVQDHPHIVDAATELHRSRASRRGPQPTQGSGHNFVDPSSCCPHAPLQQSFAFRHDVTVPSSPLAKLTVVAPTAIPPGRS